MERGNYKKDYEKQINMFLRYYPFDPSIINFALLGNHDGDFFNGGLDLKQLLSKKRFDIKTLDYQNAFIKVKNDEIRLIHPIEKSFNIFADNSKIIFRGHSHASDIKTNAFSNSLCAFVPTCSNILTKEGYKFPGIYDVNFKFSQCGMITEVDIGLYIYVNELVKVGEVSHKFHAPEQYNLIKYEEKPKKLILTK